MSEKNPKSEIRNSREVTVKTRFKLACADFTFPLLPHGKVLDLIAALDFDGVDIGLFEGRSHLWPSKEFKNLTKSAKALKKKLDACGLACADVFLQMAPSFVPYAINQPEAARRRKARDELSLGGDRGQCFCAVPEGAGRWVAGMDAGGARDFAGSLRDPVVHVDAAPQVSDGHHEDEKRDEHEREFDEALARLQ